MSDVELTREIEAGLDELGFELVELERAVALEPENPFAHGIRLPAYSIG